jgi:hypothetical protein
MDEINVDQVDLGDNEFIRLGNSQDLTLVHDASNSIINQAGIGDLLIQKAGSTKLTVNSTGIDVTGTVTADGLVVGDTSFSFSAVYIISSATGESELRMGDTDTDAGSIAYTNSDDTMTFRAAAGARMSLDSTGIDVTGTLTTTGSVGIGTSSPASELHVKSSGTSSDTLTIENSTGNGSWRVKEGSSSNALLQGYNASNSETIRLDPTSDTFFNGGNVGIGTSSPFFTTAGRSSLSVNGTSSSILAFGKGGSSENYILADAGGLTIANTSATLPTTFFNNASNSMTIDASGNVGIGASTALTGTYLSKAFVQTAGGANFALGGGSNTNNAVLGRFTSYNTSNSNSGNESSANFYGVTSIESVVVTTDSNAGADSGGSILFKTKPEAGALTEAMRIDASGNVGIGDDNPLSILHIGGGSDANVPVTFAPSTGGNAEFRNTSSTGTFTFTTNNGSSEAMRISGGNLLVGNTGLTSARTSIYNSGVDALRIALSDDAASSTSFIACFSDSTTTAYGTLRLNIVANGNVTNSNNSYGAISDEKLKENITDATPKLDSINQVRVVNYNLISDPENKQLGVIAQELEQIFPNMVEEFPDKDNNGNDLGTTTKTVKYSVFVPMLIKAIQEQQAIIEALTARIEALES